MLRDRRGAGSRWGPTRAARMLCQEEITHGRHSRGPASRGGDRVPRGLARERTRRPALEASSWWGAAARPLGGVGLIWWRGPNGRVRPRTRFHVGGPGPGSRSRDRVFKPAVGVTWYATLSWETNHHAVDPKAAPVSFFRLIFHRRFSVRPRFRERGDADLLRVAFRGGEGWARSRCSGEAACETRARGTDGATLIRIGSSPTDLFDLSPRLTLRHLGSARGQSKISRLGRGPRSRIVLVVRGLVFIGAWGSAFL